MPGCSCETELESIAGQRRVLYALIAINAVMFLIELSAGLYAQSTGLLADSLDMLADAGVYGIALYAVGHSFAARIRAAAVSGILQILLSIGVAIDVIVKLVVGSEPQSVFMVGVGTIALLANVVCLVLISRHRKGEVHMRASWIFSKNDVIANFGIIISGLLVAWLGSRLPDLVIGMFITLLVLRGGLHIVQDARKERRRMIAETGHINK